MYVRQPTGYQAANELVSKFVENGILEEITRQVRNRRFRYQRYIDLFRDDVDEAER
jgi:DNA-nicking Smr family endonuclease